MKTKLQINDGLNGGILVLNSMFTYLEVCELIRSEGVNTATVKNSHV